MSVTRTNRLSEQADGTQLWMPTNGDTSKGETSLGEQAILDFRWLKGWCMYGLDYDPSSVSVPRGFAKCHCDMPPQSNQTSCGLMAYLAVALWDNWKAQCFGPWSQIENLTWLFPSLPHPWGLNWMCGIHGLIIRLASASICHEIMESYVLVSLETSRLGDSALYRDWRLYRDSHACSHRDIWPETPNWRRLGEAASPSGRDIALCEDLGAQIHHVRKEEGKGSQGKLSKDLNQAPSRAQQSPQET